MKKITYMLISALLFSYCFSATVFAADWQQITSEEIVNGVTYKKILRYADGEFSMLHVVESDTKNPAASLGVMTAQKGVSYLENTQTMAEKNNAIAGINGDFFNTGSERTNMLGVVYQGGELISTPSKDVWATLAVTDSGNILMDYFGFTGRVTAENGVGHDIYHINKMPSTGGAVNMFTSKWGATVTLTENMHALLIKDGVVTARITTPGEIAFGDNDTMLTANYIVNGVFDNFAIGERAVIEYSLTGTDAVITEAVGGNTILVEDGKVAKFTHDATGIAQRTAIGINREGTRLYLVVAEGRQATYPGFTQESFSGALIELDCYRAINLDGGGSSTLVTKDDMKGTMEVRNDIYRQREVSTAIGLFNKLPQIGNVASGVCVPDSDTVFSGDYLDIYAKFYDSNFHIASVQNMVVTTDNPADTVSGQRVYFNGGGKRNVYVTAGGVTASAEVYVIDTVASAVLYPENITVPEGGNVNLAVTVWDSEGRKAFVHPERVDWISSGMYVENGSVGYGTGYAGVDFGTATAYCSVNGGKAPENTVMRNHFMDNSYEGTRIRISAGSGKYSTLADMIRALNYEYTLLGADYLYMLNAPLVKDIEYLSPDKFSKITVDNSMIMTINSSSGSIKEGNQLAEIISIKNAPQKNVVIITEKPAADLGEAERELVLGSLRDAAAAGKNVFIVYEAANARAYTENGINFIGCESHSSAEDILGRTVDFYISGDNISYSL